MPSFFDDATDNNPFALRRFGNIFGGARTGQDLGGFRSYAFPQQQDKEPPTPQVQAPGLPTYRNPYGGQAAEAYRQHIAAMPQEKDYEPSQGRRLGAALIATAAAFGKNPNAADIGAGVRDEPYQSALENWQLKGAGLKEQAGIEAQDVKGQLEYANMLREQAQKDREYNLNVQKAQGDIQNNQSLAAYRQAQIANMKNQGWIQSTNAKGELVLYHPGTGEMMNMGPSIEQSKMGIQLDQLADQQARTNILAGNAADARARTGIMGQNAATYAQSVRNQAPENKPGTFISPADQFRADAIATQNVVKAHPEWGNWVKADGTVKGPGDYSRFTGYDPTKDPNYKTFLQAIEQEKQKILGTRRPGVVPPPGGLLAPGGALRFDDLEK